MDQLIEMGKSNSEKDSRQQIHSSESENKNLAQQDEENIETKPPNATDSSEIIADNSEDAHQKKEVALLLKKKANSFFVDQNFQEVA